VVVEARGVMLHRVAMAKVAERSLARCRSEWWLSQSEYQFRRCGHSSGGARRLVRLNVSVILPLGPDEACEKA
jgi:hypothetical protein